MFCFLVLECQVLDTIYKEGKVLGIGKLINGKRVGEWNYNLKNGIAYQKVEYYTSDSAVVREYKDGDDEEQIYFSAVYSMPKKKISNIHLYLESFYYAYYDSVYNIFPNGNYVIYYATNGIAQTGRMKNGLRDGQWILRYASGSKGNVINYSNGKFDGRWEVFYDFNGVKMIDGEYKTNAKTGEWKEYYENGQLKSVGCYNIDVNAIIVTNLNIDSLKSQFSLEENFESFLLNSYPYDFKSGIWKYYSEKGVIKLIETYKKGQIFRREDFDKNGVTKIVIQR